MGRKNDKIKISFSTKEEDKKKESSQVFFFCQKKTMDYPQRRVAITHLLAMHLNRFLPRDLALLVAELGVSPVLLQLQNFSAAGRCIYCVKESTLPFCTACAQEIQRDGPTYPWTLIPEEQEQAPRVPATWFERWLGR